MARTIRIDTGMFWHPSTTNIEGRVYICAECLLEHLARMNVYVEEGSSATNLLRILTLNIKGISEERHDLTYYPKHGESSVVRRGEE